MSKLVIISGCSGGGKSTLLSEIRRRGYAVVEEPGRRIVLDELQSGGHALPWVNRAAFAQRALDMSIADYDRAAQIQRVVFFDRGLIDAAHAVQQAIGEPALLTFAPHYPFHKLVFMAPPWPELYKEDGERKHTYLEALREYGGLLKAYKELGYDTVLLPKVDVVERAAFVLTELGLNGYATH